MIRPVVTSKAPNLRVRYLLTCRDGESADLKAREIALEQTVELPDRTLTATIRDSVVGRTVTIDAVSHDRFRVAIDYPLAAIGEELLQLVNLLFGNISLKSGILVESVELPESLLATWGGPGFGIDGLRGLFDGRTDGRPLLCCALKPMGLSTDQLAELAYRFARGGADIVKDDHGLADQPSAPFEERVAACSAAIHKANLETGSATLYAPHLSGASSQLERRAEVARAHGCRLVLVCPLLIGLETTRRLATERRLALLAHPSMSGAYFHDDHGLAPGLLLGRLFRLAGADAVIYPNAGGRFPFDETRCAAINDELRSPWGPVRRSFPMPGGGIDLSRAPEWIARYGKDTILLIGGSLYERDDLETATRELVDALCSGT